MQKYKEDSWQMPKFEPLVYITEDAYKYGLDFYKEVDTKMRGCIASGPTDTAVLAAAVEIAGDGNHLEIGAFMGGTAIVSALVKQATKKEGQIVCLDNFSYMSEEFEVGPELIMSNARLFGVDHRIQVVRGNTHPWTLAGTFVSTHVDAAHDYDNALRDITTAMRITKKIITVHDYDRGHDGVVQAVSQAASQASNWVLGLITGHTAVFVRT